MNEIVHTPNGTVEIYSWKEFQSDMYEKMLPALESIHAIQPFTSVWGPPRGGLFAAGIISYWFDIALYIHPKTNEESMLVVDDIADTGKTLSRFLPLEKRRYTIATLFYHRQSSVVPTIWLREKTTDWIKFPWERKMTPD
ncbi:MAG: hypothetical protein A3H69_01040 [Candidatus Sungbacteria bacterium RIFCSPLOWO2_02_FULL_47_9]|uniref:Phosphoribosyltransferase domain-containing protein n=1 Tax=Candidatus Sungbacteria bacterium RIFCSPHIGHO2_01_FULL_47_32 TaxID=1802264 RepID=A0A1G2K5Z6_9BACT|nr:MAG: hypothetical protein UX72_C0001G0153 [Parcubacteria group bacterium GW2011_GWA2_47_10]OGZ93900.1 MAG: hypothetical protein A2633_05290 [Candidatus Sungbacteria bacterium RIFCSPHIGHO2_01_FULL_47_32]OGZ99152.1 MAG: hypothetical protein A3D57_05340 [Candidatus Sungbacteria bacterium RIFCSPHIGHO2_02_FULL_46_12]OHA06028.1 MAG: hypothetical protein A3A28_05350 [Candidatus Sungbacteria bacterium RIFCSPLOWO2_01_FULL_47_32]OHA09319.1 MAG: hypothetical protein A3H69_01040 [Candidatus Sungbacteria